MDSGELAADFELRSLSELEAWAGRIAGSLAQGDTVALQGDLGAGKTTLARAILAALGLDEAVPSPSFTLVQRYETPRLTVSHFDLYRIEHIAELDELGIDDALSEGAVLIEWPERAGTRLPAGALHVQLAIIGDEFAADAAARAQTLCRHPAARVECMSSERSGAIAEFLHGAGWQDAVLTALPGDASTRRYWRVAVPGRRAMLMDQPQGAETPASPPGASAEQRRALGYNAVARLAGADCGRFVAAADYLRGRDSARRRSMPTIPRRLRAAGGSR